METNDLDKKPDITVDENTLAASAAGEAVAPTQKPARSKTKRNVLIVVLSVLIAIMLFVWTVVGYLLSVICGFYRLPDNLALTPENSTSAVMSADGTFKVITYNVGFGAYSPDYTFFMDTGIMKDGTKTQGVFGKAKSKAEVEKNTAGAAGIIAKYAPDFAIIQEVDHDSTRSYDVDQRITFGGIAGYGSVYANNYHSSYLLYPFNDPIGASNSGIMTLSKYRIEDSVRRSFPIADDLSKLTDLDRCFSVTHIPVDNGKKLALISLHMSAYDEGGVIRKKQAELLKSVLSAEYAAGNYVIAGGDFNQDLIGNLEKFDSDQKIPEWVATYDKDNDIPEHFEICADDSKSYGTCRGADIPWERGKTYMCVIDGFIVSTGNITVESVNIIDSDFAYSDHNPVELTFSFKQ